MKATHKAIAFYLTHNPCSQIAGSQLAASYVTNVSAQIFTYSEDEVLQFASCWLRMAGQSVDLSYSQQPTAESFCYAEQVCSLIKTLSIMGQSE